ALYWRAALAATAADAERDLRRIVIEFPLSRQAGDALLRLAQLEQARGDRLRAKQHLQRLALEHPASAARGRGSYMLARMLFDEQSFQRGCIVLEDAARTVSESEAEVRNQIDYLRQRCIGGGGAIGAVAEGGLAVPGARAPAGGPPPISESMRPPANPPHPSAAPRTMTPRPAPAAAGGTAVAGARGYSVQVGAFRARADAEQERSRLAARGFQTRVFAGGGFYRVRIGRYATRADATAAVERMKTSELTGFVVEDERR
ncbi:MAG: SPOR domain-containing protein, partial [Gemmatimonadota bacterium]|nr:SPOR domain-containing protein [Gemmatimonadota bacterium]